MAMRADRVGVRYDQVDVHGRITSPSFLNELLEDLPEWTDMPVWVNGTEELLPSNNSVPVTSPILADIAYPDIRRDNQYFIYRESPTPVDGLAKIKSIKGNTLVWNQLIESNITVNLNRDSARTYNIATNNTRSVVGHKYYFATTVTSDTTITGLNCRYGRDFAVGQGVGRRSIIFTATDANNASIYCYIGTNEETGTAITFKDTVLIDLTLMGLDSVTTDELISLFSLPYYDYNAGTLLSFNGTGLKTANEDESEEHTTTLPISTYFPTGMKSAGSVYDELTPTKSIIRIGAVTFNGSETWNYDSNNALFQCAVSGAIITDATTQYNVYTKNNRFDDKSWATRSEGSFGMYYGASYIFIKSTQFADVNALKTWLQSNPLTVYYVLATPVELPTMSFE